jgi:acyl-CoA synthetase (AMP-forming)/AMP-acid ligase II
LEAAVVLHDPIASSETIEIELRQSLPDFKIPKRWHVLAELPLGPTGKLDRAALVEATAHRPPPTDIDE